MSFLSWTHDTDDCFEFYIADDDLGRQWEVFRHLQGLGNMTRVWFVWLTERSGRVQILNGVLWVPAGGYEVAGVLYDLDPCNPVVLMAGVEDLIQRNAPLDAIRRPLQPRRV